MLYMYSILCEMSTYLGIPLAPTRGYAVARQKAPQPAMESQTLLGLTIRCGCRSGIWASDIEKWDGHARYESGVH